MGQRAMFVFVAGIPLRPVVIDREAGRYPVRKEWAG